MKLLSFIFSIFVLVLSMVPCCVDNNCNDDERKAQTNNQHQNDEDNGCNNCSPFFTCGSCPGFVFSNEGLRISETQLVKDKFIPDYWEQFTPGFRSSIWQPPKRK